MSDILTWHERAMRHPDHQSGMVSEDMIRARMCEEIEDLRAEVERLRGDRDKMLLNERDFVRKHRAEIERLTRERDEARAEVERLKKDLRQGFPIRYETSAGCMCPAEANLHCQNSFCPRRNPPGVTCQGGKP